MAFRELGPRWLLYGALALVVMYGIGRWQGVSSVAEAAAEQDARDILKLKAPYLAQIGKLRQLETAHQMVAQVWHRRADSLRARAVAVDTVVVSDSSPVSLWRATANACQQEAAEGRTALAACQQRALVAEQRAAALDSSLATLLKVKSCKILFIRCPSRTAMFLVGTGLGFAGGLVVH